MNAPRTKSIERHYAAEVLGDIDAGKMPSAATAYRAFDEAETLRAENKRLREALRSIAKPALGGKQQQYAAQAILCELGEIE